MKRKFDECTCLIFTSILFFISIFLGKYLFFIGCVIWLINVGYCMYKMMKARNYTINNFVKEVEKKSQKHLEEGATVQGIIEMAIIPLFVLAGFAIVASLIVILIS